MLHVVRLRLTDRRFCFTADSRGIWRWIRFASGSVAVCLTVMDTSVSWGPHPCAPATGFALKTV
jgi:hydrogenase maturation factor